MDGEERDNLSSRDPNAVDTNEIFEKATTVRADNLQESFQIEDAAGNFLPVPCVQGIRYLNIAQQTDDIKRSNQCVIKCSRDTQLCEKRNQCWNTTRETWTQTERKGILLDSSQDYARYAGPYEDSRKWEEKRNKAAIVIQQYARRRNARHKLDILRKFTEQRLELFTEQEKNHKFEEASRLEQEIHRHRHPRSKKDFQVLYRELEEWHREECKSIMKKHLQSEEKKVALLELLGKEVKFFQAICKMKLAVAKDNREDRIQAMFHKMSAAKSWELSNGSLVHVQTPSTLRAADLMRLYTALAKCAQTIDERMCVLGYIKWTVQEFDCPLTKELVQLIEREADLMYRNRPTQSLLGLRQRILDLFLRFVQVPEFNAEAAHYQCVPVDFDHASCQSLRRQNVPLHSVA